MIAYGLQVSDNEEDVLRFQNKYEFDEFVAKLEFVKRKATERGFEVIIVSTKSQKEVNE